MQGKIGILFYCFFSASVSADLGQKIESLGDSVKRAGNPTPTCASCNSTAAGLADDVGSLMKSCVESICQGKEASFAKTIAKIYGSAAESSATYTKEIQPLVEALAKEEAKDELNRNAAFLDWIKSPRTIQTPGAVRIINLILAGSNFSKLELVEKGGTVTIDSEKSRGAFPTMTSDEYSKFIQISSKILPALQKKAIQETDPARAQLLYGVSLKDKVEEVLASIAERKKRLAANPDLSFIGKTKAFDETFSTEKLRRQFFGSDHIDSDAIANLNLKSSQLDLYLAVGEDSEFRKILDSEPIDMNKLSAALGATTKLEERAVQYGNIVAGTALASASKCRLAFEAGQQGLPSLKEIADFRARLNNIKAEFLKRTVGLVCASAKEPYRGQVSAWNAIMPQSKESHFANMKASLQRELSETAQLAKNFKDYEKSSDRDAIYSIGLVQAAIDDDSNPARLADDACDDLIPNLAPDATAEMATDFVVGPMPAKFPEALGISFHEMGHKLFKIMKEKGGCADNADFGKARSCLIQMHTENPLEDAVSGLLRAMIGGEAQYESEDWADLIAAHVEGQSDNFACLFAKQIKDDEYKELSLKNPDASDPHSSSLFRLLHVNFIKHGSLPPACSQALAARGEKPNFKNCLITR